MLTENEKKILRFLAISSEKDYSINSIAKTLKLSPNGALKILNKFVKEGIFFIKEIANIKSYKLNFNNEKTIRVLELAFIPNTLSEKLKIRDEDLNKLKGITKACLIFGSYITTKLKPNDLDILFIIDKSNFLLYKKNLEKVQDLIPFKIHDLLLTTEDLNNNIKEKNPAVINALLNGIVLWGVDVIVKEIKHGYK